MGLFNNFPYMDLSNLNLDFILKKLKDLTNYAESAEQAAESAEQSASSAQQSAESAEQSASSAQQSAESAEGSADTAQNYAEHIADPVGGLVTGWLDDNITPTTPPVDASLSIQGAAADAKATGDAIASLRGALNDAVPYRVKLAIDNILQNVAFKNNDVYTSDLNTVHVWATDINVTSITAVYTQSGTVYNTDTLESLRANLVVTAYFDNATSAIVSGYTLSGELTPGTSVITVIYGGKTATFTVTVSQRIVTHTYANNQYQAISDPSEMSLTAGMVASGGIQSKNGRVDPDSEAVAGRAADTQRVLVGNFGGKTVGLSSYTLSTGAAVYFACWFGRLTNNQWDGLQYVNNSNNYIASAWLNAPLQLPASSDTNVLVIAFRKGDGNIGDFTAAELAEITGIITIS